MKNLKFSEWYKQLSEPTELLQLLNGTLEKYAQLSLEQVLENKELLTDSMREALRMSHSKQGITLLKVLKEGFPSNAMLQRELIPSWGASEGIPFVQVGNNGFRIDTLAMMTEGVLEECEDRGCLILEYEGMHFIAFSQPERLKDFKHLGIGETLGSKIIQYFDETTFICVLITSDTRARGIDEIRSSEGEHHEHEDKTEISHHDLVKSGDAYKAALAGIISYAVAMEASDLHLIPRPNDNEVDVVVRIDGSKSPVPKEHEIDIGTYYSIRDYLNRVSSDQDSPIFIPKDGNTLTFHSTNKRVRLRPAFMPLGLMKDIATNPVKMTMRIIPVGDDAIPLYKLGLPDICFDHTKQAVDIKGKMVLVVGPVNTGKSTTLYSSLKYWVETHPDKLAGTIEDPIEQLVEGVVQVQISDQARKQNIGYEHYLKGSVRGDLDALCISEIRDRATLETAIQFAAIGSKIMSTFHAGDEISGLMRAMMMLDDAHQKHLFLSNIGYIFSQRLVPMLCPKCKQEKQGVRDELIRSADKWVKLGCDKEIKQLIPEIQTLPLYERNPKGCEHCNMKGVVGIKPVMGILEFTNEVIDLILSERPTRFVELKKHRATTLQEEIAKILLEGECDIEALNI
ncbi:ATPase, T2SS/T4P/T4SS family [Vibrio rotiferianus]|uniref:ATPase, T2SS/T4P/T4SS family n=1 Tax=Vibrio rotiferianus TaxID=190895 RepID=UPI0005EF7776|nr:ATPase, T2SS/T4P/T4SS family [Vibrio rotiferianus]